MVRRAATRTNQEIHGAAKTENYHRSSMNQVLKNQSEVHVVFNAVSTHPGGGLTVLLGMLNGLAAQDQVGFRATVICSAEATRKAIEEQGIAEVKQPLVDASAIKRQLWVNTKLASYVLDLKADIVLSINQFVRGVKCPQVIYHLNVLRFMPIQPDGSILHKIAEHLRNYSAVQALKKADANVFESAFIKTCAESIHDRKNPLDQVIYIGLPDDLIVAEQNEASYKSGQLFTITSPCPHKDNTTLIRTIAELIEVRPDVNWHLKIAAGFGDWWAPYKELAKSLGVFDRIQWLGFIDQPQLTNHLRESLCLISTSRIESFCMVAMESMARGCPPIVADCSAMPESVDNAGLLAAAGSHKEFAERVIDLHDSPTTRKQYVDRGFERVKSFRWNTCGEQFATLFSQLNNNDS